MRTAGVQKLLALLFASNEAKKPGEKVVTPGGKTGNARGKKW